MAAVEVEVFQLRVPPNGRDIMRRCWAKAGPVLRWNHATQLGKHRLSTQPELVVRSLRDIFVKADIFQRTADQQVTVTARNQVQIALKYNMAKRRLGELEQQHLPSTRLDVHR